MKSINIPIQILTQKLARNKQDSVFYAGKDIAKVKVANREYVLTTSGEYRFAKGGVTHDENSKTVKTLNDEIIKRLGDNDLISNWGWFGINLWINDKCQSVPTDCYSRYDEAMVAFVEFVIKDLTKGA